MNTLSHTIAETSRGPRKRWTHSADVHAQLEKLWARGDLLASLATGVSLFPQRLMLKAPTARELTERFDEVRAWIAELRALTHCRVELREVHHRVLGHNAIPAEIWIDTLDDALVMLAKQHDALRFDSVLARTQARQPMLLDWIAKHPLRALALADAWEPLLDVVAWMQAHPRPNVYLRQVDIVGVHSKFIEAHRGVLAELLDIILPSAAIDVAATGVGQFARRYGFCDKPSRIRFRVLDPACAILPGTNMQDVTLDVDSFAHLKLKVTRVFITENEINFLSFPHLAASMVVFGAGYGFEHLAQARWLMHCKIYYWGDIDTHGFAILDQLRSHFAHVESLLMDRATFDKFKSHWSAEEKPVLRDLPRLTDAERALYDDLRDRRVGSNVRLEQERIAFGWLKQALAGL
ncbi:MAG: Wadjet anti-phage system protein JetD domain-containing protein [Pseudomonadota bacterium]